MTLKINFEKFNFTIANNTKAFCNVLFVHFFARTRFSCFPVFLFRIIGVFFHHRSPKSTQKGSRKQLRGFCFTYHRIAFEVLFFHHLFHILASFVVIYLTCDRLCSSESSGRYTNEPNIASKREKIDEGLDCRIIIVLPLLVHARCGRIAVYNELGVGPKRLQFN